ncbi:homeodomain-interacting protein kinase 1-like [Hippoglossus hippoglossus]|uniref:homeodomain-interacting protein kinase 1-like n=1 Tax=Hippoglossus hippoglossus TaxID=8267 RepID=UPI00148D2905|nr:homeodomain-interacting protein kinase 1-like [Hippoglossus hippoglossus]
MSQNSELEITVGDLIPSPTTQYQAQKVLGSGYYGVVIQCRNVTTDETVALKMIKRMEDIDSAMQEEVTLQTMKALHSERFNIVRFDESFTYKGHYCHVFEHLDMDLQKFKQISPGQHLQLKQIRPILQQLATSLEFLNSAGIIHADLKPDNIMLVDHVRKPLKVKVIDFGLAFDDPEEQIGDVIQPVGYRSPEVLYREPFSGAIDVWSLGCIAAELFMGSRLFPGSNENELLRQVAFAIRDPEHEGNFLPHAFWPRRWMEARFMDPSSDDGGHGDQVILQMSLKEDASSSTASPAKERSPASPAKEHSPASPAKERSPASPAKERSPAGMTNEKHSKMNAKRGTM